MVCPKCQDDPCSCAKIRVIGTTFVTQECAAEDCHVMIRALSSQLVTDQLCKWCQAKLQKHDVMLKGPLPPSDGKEVSRDEFGLDLYECIKTIGGIMQLKKFLNDPHIREHPSRRPRELATWERQLNDLLMMLPNQLAALPEAQASEVTARYPWIMEL